VGCDVGRGSLRAIRLGCLLAWPWWPDDLWREGCGWVVGGAARKPHVGGHVCGQATCSYLALAPIRALRTFPSAEGCSSYFLTSFAGPSYQRCCCCVGSRALPYAQGPTPTPPR